MKNQIKYIVPSKNWSLCARLRAANIITAGIIIQGFNYEGTQGDEVIMGLIV